MKPAARQEMFSRLAELNPHPTTELEYRTPFELLVAVILSAQTALRVHKGRLFTPNSFDSIHIENVQVEAGRSRASSAMMKASASGRSRDDMAAATCPTMTTMARWRPSPV